jgi:hypothetical protein
MVKSIKTLFCSFLLMSFTSASPLVITSKAAVPTSLKKSTHTVCNCHQCTTKV